MAASARPFRISRPASRRDCCFARVAHGANGESSLGHFAPSVVPSGPRPEERPCQWGEPGVVMLVRLREPEREELAGLRRAPSAPRGGPPMVMALVRGRRPSGPSGLRYFAPLGITFGRSARRTTSMCSGAAGNLQTMARGGNATQSSPWNAGCERASGAPGPCTGRRTPGDSPRARSGARQAPAETAKAKRGNGAAGRWAELAWRIRTIRLNRPGRIGP